MPDSPAPTQLSLFDPVLPGREREFLASLATIWAALVASPTLGELARSAQQEAKGRGGNRGIGEVYEAAFGKLLTTDAQAAISAETVAALDPGAGHGLQTLRSVTWVALNGGRAPADFIITLQFVAGGMLEVPVNLKRTTASGSENDAVAVRTLIRVAQGHGALSNSPVNVPQVALRWWAGRERIQPGDYLLLLVVGAQDADDVVVAAQGLLSGVTGDGLLAAVHHPNREVVLYRHATGVIADDLDVNTDFARVLSPDANVDALKLALLVWMRGHRGWAKSTTQRHARALLDASDADLATGLLKALTTLPRRV